MSYVVPLRIKISVWHHRCCMFPFPTSRTAALLTSLCAPPGQSSITGCTVQEEAWASFSRFLQLRTTQTEHIMPLLQQLYWLSVCFWVHFNVMVITYEVLYGLGPGYLKDSPYEPFQHLRLSDKALLSVPLTVQAWLLGI